jgi:hypothetical protein
VRKLLSALLWLTCGWAALYWPEVAFAEMHPRDPAALVFVANGCGDLSSISTSLRQVAAETGLPLQIETCNWSHGSGRYLIDHVDHANHRAHGWQLAARIVACRQACPDRRIYLIGHSAGCAVVLAAAEMLPPDSVDCIILLAPSVSAAYDLRQALLSARCGIDVFYSRRDRLVLGLTMRIVGTADHRGRKAAGRVGFRPVLACPEDAVLYSKLRQHPWQCDVAWTGNHGGHNGCKKACFLRAYVLPLLAQSWQQGATLACPSFTP